MAESTFKTIQACQAVRLEAGKRQTGSVRSEGSMRKRANLEAWQLTTLTRLGTLCHLELDLIGIC